MVTEIVGQEAFLGFCRCEAGVGTWEYRRHREDVRWDVPGYPGQPPVPRHSSGLKEIRNAIRSSRHITSLERDWDDEGAPGYALETWRRATGFLLALAGAMLDGFDEPLDAPRILPSAEGSIDLHWKTDSYELLINIPADPNRPAAYYGDNTQANMPIESRCSVIRPDRKLVAWLSLFK